jgi:hypothetical protein
LLYVQHADGPVDTIETEGVGVAVYAGETLLRTSGHSWDPRNGVEWHERRKAGFDTVGDAMEETWRHG